MYNTNRVVYHYLDVVNIFYGLVEGDVDARCFKDDVGGKKPQERREPVKIFHFLLSYNPTLLVSYTPPPFLAMSTTFSIDIVCPFSVLEVTCQSVSPTLVAFYKSLPVLPLL